jgi:hypothetical protein
LVLHRKVFAERSPSVIFSELKDNLVNINRGIYRKYIFGYIARVPGVWARLARQQSETVSERIKAESKKKEVPGSMASLGGRRKYADARRT